ncbi:GNAT family N-acetyltransferase [Corynebacterium sp. 335C]
MTDDIRTEVRDDAENDCFVLLVDGEHAGLIDYVRGNGVRNLTHTEVDDAYQGKGLSKVLIKEALDQSIAAGDTIIPTCPAIDGFVEKNRDAYGPHLAPR